MIPAIVFSKDRACQLDALLRSLDTYAPSVFSVSVIYKYTSAAFSAGYAQCATEHQEITFIREKDFRSHVVEAVQKASDLVGFFTDDDVLFKSVDASVIEDAMRDTDVLAFSLRLGQNTTHCYPLARTQSLPTFEPHERHITWVWHGADGDFSYPLSVDGHIFHAADIHDVVSSLAFASPNSFEAELASRSPLFTKPKLACYPHSTLVNIPANRVQNEYTNRSGQDCSMSTEQFNRTYLQGARLEFDTSAVIGAHQELPSQFATRSPTNILDILEQGDVVFDVGAHIGNKSALYLSKGARVVCFEPQPSCAAQLRQRFGDRVVVEEIGLADSPGTLPLSLCTTSTLSTFSDAWKKGRFSSESWPHQLVVPVSTLDHEIQKHGLPKFCKLDVEGFERQVLAGLSQAVPYLSFEFCNEYILDATACVEHLQSLGYRKFNACIGEDPHMVFDSWVTSETVFARLAELANQDAWLWGDIYACH